MIYEGYDVVTRQGVSKSGKDILVANGIKPGTKGTVISECTMVTVDFGGKVVILKDSDIEIVYNKSKSGMYEDDENLNFLKSMFGMK
jgi:hypothetical protein